MHSQITYNRSIQQDKYWIFTRLDNYFFENFSYRKGRRQIMPWQINEENSWACNCPECTPTGTGVICLLLQIVYDTVCLVLALLVDMNEIWLWSLLVEMTDFLLLELDGVVERLLWCLLVDLTEFLLEELSGIAITLPLAFPTFFL